MKTRVKKTAVKRTRKKPMINNIYKSLIIFLTIIYSRIQELTWVLHFFIHKIRKPLFLTEFSQGKPHWTTTIRFLEKTRQ